MYPSIIVNNYSLEGRNVLTGMLDVGLCNSGLYLKIRMIKKSGY